MKNGNSKEYDKIYADICENERDMREAQRCKKIRKKRDFRPLR